VQSQQLDYTGEQQC